MAIHIINPTFEKTLLKIGRGHDCDIKINDISVSRFHALLKVDNGKFDI